jgi:Bacteriophage baseplate protein W
MIVITATPSAVDIETTSRGVLTLSLSVDETDPYLSLVRAAVSWGDGQVYEVPLQAKPIGPLTLEHAYPPGAYLVSVTAYNAAAPNPARAVWTSPLTVTLANQVVVPVSQPVVAGPIFPRFNGSPGPGQWEFNTGTDGLCLEASLVSILFTNPGERLMLPDFGAGIRKLVFDPNDGALSSQARQMAAAAVSRWEPRASLDDLKMIGTGRDAMLSFTFSSKLAPETFTFLVPVPSSS